MSISAALLHRLTACSILSPAIASLWTIEPCLDSSTPHPGVAVAEQWTDDQLFRGGWRGSVLGPDGNKVYGIPTNASTVLEVDPIRGEVRTFGRLGPPGSDNDCAGALHCGIDKWIGGVLAPNGKIIGIPYGAESVLEIDPVKSTVSTFGVIASDINRKWLGGVLGANGLIYAIPYDAESVLQINPETHALSLFGNLGSQPCKWYGGVLAPNHKIYAIPYSERYVLEIDPDTQRASAFSLVAQGWGKWAGGVLGPNGRIYGIPALATTVLEINADEPADTTTYGMLPNKGMLTDKWNGGVLAPNGRIYGIPWRSTSILEFDPATKAISLLGNLPPTNFSWGGAALTKAGKIVALPYNSKHVLEIGHLCGPSAAKPLPLSTAGQVTAGLSTSAARNDAGEPTIADGRIQPYTKQTIKPATVAPDNSQTFVLAMIGCPEAAKTTEDMCFSMGHRTWHSAMITIAERDTTLSNIREKVANSGLAHLPPNYCFLFQGHPLDPTIEQTLKATTVASKTAEHEHLVVFIDHVQCAAVQAQARLSPAAISRITTYPVAITLALLALLLCVGALASGRRRKCVEHVDGRDMDGKCDKESQTNCLRQVQRLGIMRGRGFGLLSVLDGKHKSETASTSPDVTDTGSKARLHRKRSLEFGLQQDKADRRCGEFEANKAISTEEDPEGVCERLLPS